MNAHSLEMRKELGAYYTPSELSEIMSDWAIRQQSDKVLEPSFGGCGFLESCELTLRNLGAIKPLDNIFGVDIDIKAFDTLKNKFANKNIESRFILNDFINVAPIDFGGISFDVIIGNPPYISMHNMNIEQRISCEKVLSNSPFSSKTLGRNASLWCFFLLHALSFLAEKGRSAWVLPSSFLNAYYAKALISIYEKHFDTLKIIKINERLFKSEGADEMSVLFLCEGFHKENITNGKLSISFAESVSELGNIISGADYSVHASNDNYKYNILPKDAFDLYKHLKNMKACYKIKDFADIKIGMVTGFNNFFILNKQEVMQYRLGEENLRPVVSRFSHLKGIKHNVMRHNKNVKDHKNAFLLHVDRENLVEKNTAVRSYLAKVRKQERLKNRTFKKRKYWYQPDDGIYPDAFLSYMVHESPKMVLNQGKINCTNSIHRVFFKEKPSFKRKIAFCISLLSTFSQLSAELEGRSYGSGVLKIEPTAGKNIQIFIDEYIVDDLFDISKTIDSLMINDRFNNAVDLVDNVLIKRNVISSSELVLLKKALLRLRADRYKGVKSYE